MELGKRIVQELQLEDNSNLLTHWMAYRIAELIDKVEKIESESKSELETTKQECTDLILKVWEKHNSWSKGQPLGQIITSLQELTEEKSFRFYEDSIPSSITWLQLLDYLKILQEEESCVCLEAYITTLNLDKEQKWLNNFPEELTTDEGSIIAKLLDRRKSMNKEDYTLGSKKVSKFGLLSYEKRTKLVIDHLQEIADKRQKLFAAVAKTTLTQETLDTNES